MKLAITMGPNWKSLVYVKKYPHLNSNTISLVSYINRFGDIYLDNVVGTDWFNNEYL